VLRKTKTLHITFLPYGIQVRTIVNTLGQITNIAFSPHENYEYFLNSVLSPSFRPMPLIPRQDFIILAKIYSNLIPPVLKSNTF